jgi:PD-(D/E)XK nuclease superfamily
MAELTNEFSWSRSRDSSFHECRRRYFYQYYGAWGGWEATAPADVRRLYILKQLATRQMWGGRVVHEAIEMALHVFREGRDVPIEPFIADVIERMRGEWRLSKAGRYRESPKSPALFEHEYAIELKAQVWQALSRHVATCLRNFFRLPLLATIRRSEPEHWSIEHWSKTFEFEGTPVWMAPDFGFWTEEGRLALVDWKTGASDHHDTAFQLGGYALYAHEVLAVPPTNVDLYEVNLREPLVTPLTWSNERLEAIKERLRLSVRSMKAYLADPQTNVAVIGDFERTEELRICRWCNFRAVCRPELAGA